MLWVQAAQADLAHRVMGSMIFAPIFPGDGLETQELGLGYFQYVNLFKRTHIE